MKDQYTDYTEITSKTNEIFSPSFCFAKWYHTNIYFQTGETHSCYHPAPHFIDVKAIKANPAALHNTPTKIGERRQMLNGLRPDGCKYCWNIEDLDKNLISDRQIRTGSLYTEERVTEIKENDSSFFVDPDYIELSFSNLCNFKCGYCHPKASSRYYNEIKQYGPYVKSKNHRCDIDWFKIYEEEDNPFLEAWWKWWPTLSKKLNILRITGGEPLIQKSTYKMLEYLHQFPNPNLELNINSNLGSKNEVVLKFCQLIENTVNNKSVKSFKLFTSVDTWGPQAEYIRTGLDLNVFEENMRTYLSETKSPVTIMITFNIFSMFQFTNLLKKILDWRQEFQNEQNNYLDFHRVRFDISYLKEPLQYDINLLPKNEFLPYMEKCLDFVNANTDDSSKNKFSFIENQKLLRIYEYMKNTQYSAEKLNEGYLDFFNFFSEFDRRRQTNLLETFSEITSFWEMCRKKANQ